jgi:cytochrome c-type biogenesis protein CcmH/NrfG
MSAGAIVAIIIAAAIVLTLLLVLLPAARRRKQERAVRARRDEVATAHRSEADDRLAEARLAEKEAARRRAEAELHQERAELHQRGLADDQLDSEHERVQEGRFVRERHAAGASEETDPPRR